MSFWVTKRRKGTAPEVEEAETEAKGRTVAKQPREGWGPNEEGLPETEEEGEHFQVSLDALREAFRTRKRYRKREMEKSDGNSARGDRSESATAASTV